jgi:hypothetical protein
MTGGKKKLPPLDLWPNGKAPPKELMLSTESFKPTFQRVCPFFLVFFLFVFLFVLVYLLC